MEFSQISFSGFNNQEFNRFLNESTETVSSLYTQYSNLFTEVSNALNESTAVVAQGAAYTKTDLDDVGNQGDTHIKDKIAKFVKRLIEWVIEFTKKTIEFIQNITTSNKAFVTKVKPVVEKKYISTDLREKLKMETRLYNIEFINLNKFGVLNNFVQKKFGEGDDPELIERFGDMHLDQIKIAMANMVLISNLREDTNWSEYKKELLTSVMGKQVTKNFNMKQFDVIELYSNGEEKKLIEQIEIFSRIIKTVATGFAAKARISKIVNMEPDKDKHVVVDSSIVKQKILSAFSEVMSTVSGIQLQVVRAQLKDARAFCLQAYRYNTAKSVNESTVIDSLFESDSFDVDISSLSEN
jgi:hypothetical protein